MAHANDAGVDVIDVLLDDFTAVLCRQGLKRKEIEMMRSEAVRNVDHQRRTGGGKDIVDMVMGRAHRTEPADFSRKPNPKDTARSSKIGKLAHSLQRLLSQETVTYMECQGDIGWVAQNITKTRQRVERELVYAIVGMAQSGGTMSQGDYSQWMSMFTRKEHEKREAAGRRIDLFNELARYM